MTSPGSSEIQREEVLSLGLAVGELSSGGAVPALVLPDLRLEGVNRKQRQEGRELCSCQRGAAHAAPHCESGEEPQVVHDRPEQQARHSLKGLTVVALSQEKHREADHMSSEYLSLLECGPFSGTW